MLLLLLACGGDAVVVDENAGSDTVSGDTADTGGADTASAITFVGTGADGPLEAKGRYDLSTLAPSWPVVAMEGDTVTVDGALSGLAAGDEVMIVDVHGTGKAHADVGRYVFVRVVAVGGTTVQLVDPPAAFATEGQAVVLLRVPNFTDVNVSGLLTTAAWDGETGGIVAFRAAGAVTILGGGSVNVDGLGFAGGSSSGDYNHDGYQGESYAGQGEGGEAGDSYNETNGWWAPNFGGGGSNVCGGGGEYGGGATAGDTWYPNGPYTPPQAGETYGDAELTTLFFGSGGGGVWNDGSSPGPAGYGGGMVYVAAASITAAGAQAFSARGDPGVASSQGSWTYGAGGGAGGSVFLRATSVSFVASSVSATGGQGNHDVVSWGGDGGDGRVRVDTSSVSGVALVEACEPDCFAGTL